MLLFMEEIRRSQVEVGSFIPLFAGFYPSQVVSRISEPSTVCPGKGGRPSPHPIKDL